MDSHLRERIVGAAVLVALGVWLIPWALDGPESEPAASGPAPELALPSPDSAAPTRTETVDLDPRPAAPLRVTGDTAPATAAGAGTSAALRTTSDGTAEPATGSPPNVAAAAPTAAAPAAVRPAPDPAAGGTSAAWSVQVGAFGERANAVQLANRVASYGYEAQVSEFLSNGEPMHRVRIEGFATRERAEAAGSSLSAHGIPARVVPAD